MEEKKDGREKKERSGKILSNKLATKSVLVAAVLTLVLWIAVDYAFALIGLGAIGIILVLNSVVIVPTVHFGIPTRMEKRIGKIKKVDGKEVVEIVVLDEGLDFVLPLIDDLLEKNVVSKKLTTKPITAEAISKDLLKITLKGSLQYEPNNLNVYVTRTEDTISDGMNDAIESEFGKLCGIKKADDFVKFRKEIELFINCVLQLDRPPHYFFDEKEEESRIKDYIRQIYSEDPKEAEKRAGLLAVVAKKVMGIIEIEGDSEKSKNDKKKLSPERWILTLEKDKDGNDSEDEIDVIAFYRDNAARIDLLLKLTKDQNSPVEELYGIGVATFRVAKIDFSDDVKKAFEEQRSAKAKMDAAETRQLKKMEILKRYIDMKIPLEAAVNLTETTADVKGVERQIISVEGSHSADLLAFAKLFGGGRGEGGGKK